MPPHKHKVQSRPSPLDEPPTASSSGSDEENQHHSSSPRLHHEQQVSSRDEEEASSSGEEEEEASEDLPPPVSKNPPTNPQHRSSSSSSETQSGSETESEPDPTPIKVKPVASKPMDQPLKLKSQPSPALSKSASKRPAENNNNNAARATDPKRAKKKGTDSSAAAAAPSDEEIEEEGKKSDDQLKKVLRVWSEEDEVALLKGVSDFTAKTGQDPLKSTNSSAFYNFVKKSMHGEPSSIKLKEKVRRLKKKYEILAARAAKGDPPKFVKLHDERIFELAKKAWGTPDLAVVPPSGSLDNPKSNGNAANTPKKKEPVSRTIPSAKKSKPVLVLAAASPDLKSPDKMQIVKVPNVKSSDKMQIDQNVKSSDKMLIDQKPDDRDASSFLRELARFKEGVGVSNLDEDDVKRGLELVGESKRAELRARWKKLQHAEMELFANRLELIGEQTKLILEALRSSNH